jgi:hypothetical protein
MIEMELKLNEQIDTQLTKLNQYTDEQLLELDEQIYEQIIIEMLINNQQS